LELVIVMPLRLSATLPQHVSSARGGSDGLRKLRFEEVDQLQREKGVA
jgi:hypothetical protein